MTRILGSSGSAIVASRRVRRRQDDHGTARPAHPSLRHHRNRKRKLALQKPRLTPTGSPTGAHRLPPAPTSDSRRSLHDARVPPMDSMDDPPPGSILHADLGSKFSAD